MEDYGKGILMTSREDDEIKALDEQHGLRELRAKINGQAGITDKSTPNRFSIDAALNYGTESVEIVRKFLDSGVLVRLLDTDFNQDSCWDGATAHRYITLAACAMTLGCTLPASMTATLTKMLHPAYLSHVSKLNPKFKRSPLAIEQLKKASANYQPGVPYNFGNKTRVEITISRMFPGTTKLTNMGPMKMIEVTQASGMVIPHIIGPPTDEEMGVEPIYPADVCGGCGEKPEKDEVFSRCARCTDRKYCSKACQKKHWKAHKPICMIPANEMAAFLASIPKPSTSTRGARGMFA